MHTVAPRSNSACVKSAGRARAAGSSPSRRAAAAISGRPPGNARSIAKTRAATRSTFPSTATAGTPNAMLATAAAVYAPTPGSARSPSTSRGNPPSATRRARSHAGCAPARSSPAPPGPHHRVLRRRRQRLHGRKPDEEPLEIRHDRRHRRLLQHDLAQPHLVRIGGLAWPRPPWHSAAMAVIPVQQRGGGGNGHASGMASPRTSTSAAPTVPARSAPSCPPSPAPRSASAVRPRPRSWRIGPRSSAPPSPPCQRPAASPPAPHDCLLRPDRPRTTAPHRQLMERINGHLGRIVVEQLRFARISSPRLGPPPRRAAPPPRPSKCPACPPDPCGTRSQPSAPPSPPPAAAIPLDAPAEYRGINGRNPLEAPMALTRRVLLAAAAAVPPLRLASAQSDDPRMAERALGKPDAKVRSSILQPHLHPLRRLPARDLPQVKEAHRHRPHPLRLEGLPARPARPHGRHGRARAAARPLRALRNRPALDPGPLGLQPLGQPRPRSSQNGRARRYGPPHLRRHHPRRQAQAGHPRRPGRGREEIRRRQHAQLHHQRQAHGRRRVYDTFAKAVDAAAAS